jgi:4-hydroxy-tetrahydrodipicolinate synthase
MNLQGCGTALVTPFLPDGPNAGSIDEAALHALVDSQIAEGISLLIPCGTTGEAATLTESETQRVIEITIEAAAGRVSIFAGCTHNSTAQAVLNAKRLAKIPGLTGILTANPYYNRPSQEGQFQHFRAIAEAIDLPILLYNIPARTGVNLLPETVLRLAEIPNIIGIKESSGNIPQITELLNHVNASAPAVFKVLAGDDILALPILALGAIGLISVASNAIPGPMSQMVAAALAGTPQAWSTARALNRRYFPLMQAHFSEPSPAPIKAVLEILGRCSDTVRLPMLPVSHDIRIELETLLSELSLLPAQ